MTATRTKSSLPFTQRKKEWVATSQAVKQLISLLVANMEKQPAIKNLVEQALFFHKAAKMGLMDCGKKKENEE